MAMTNLRSEKPRVGMDGPAQKKPPTGGGGGTLETGRGGPAGGGGGTCRLLRHGRARGGGFGGVTEGVAAALGGSGGGLPIDFFRGGAPGSGAAWARYCDECRAPCINVVGASRDGGGGALGGMP